MTNKELIAILQKLPANAHVFIECYGSDGCRSWALFYSDDISADPDGDINIKLI